LAAKRLRSAGLVAAGMKFFILTNESPRDLQYHPIGFDYSNTFIALHLALQQRAYPDEDRPAPSTPSTNKGQRTAAGTKDHDRRFMDSFSRSAKMNGLIYLVGLVVVVMVVLSFLGIH
jgi:hypothetical protein